MSNIHDNHNYSGSKVRDAGDFLLQLTYAYTRQAKDSPVAGAFILQDDSEQQNEQPIVSKKQKFLIFDPPLGSKEPGSAYILFFYHQCKWNVIFISIKLKIVFLYSFVNGNQVHMIKHLAKSSLVFAQVNDILKSAMGKSCALQPNQGSGSHTDETGTTEKQKYLLKVFDLSHHQDGKDQDNKTFAYNHNLLRLIYLLVQDAVGLGSQLTIKGVVEMFEHVVWEDLFKIHKSKKILVPLTSCFTIKTFRLDDNSAPLDFLPGQDLIFFCFFAQSTHFEKPFSGGRYYFDPRYCEPLLLQNATEKGMNLVLSLFLSNIDFDLFLQCYTQFQAHSRSVKLTPMLVTSMFNKLKFTANDWETKRLFDSLNIARLLDYLFDENNIDQNKQYYLGSVFPLINLPPASLKAPQGQSNIIPAKENIQQQAKMSEIPSKRSQESAFVSPSETVIESRSVSMPESKRQKTISTPTISKPLMSGSNKSNANFQNIKKKETVGENGTKSNKDEKNGGGDDDESDSGSDSDILEISDGEFTELQVEQQQAPELAKTDKRKAPSVESGRPPTTSTAIAQKPGYLLSNRVEPSVPTAYTTIVPSLDQGAPKGQAISSTGVSTVPFSDSPKSTLGGHVQFSASFPQGRKTGKENGNNSNESAGYDNINDDVSDNVFDDSPVHAPSATSPSTVNSVDPQSNVKHSEPERSLPKRSKSILDYSSAKEEHSRFGDRIAFDKLLKPLNEIRDDERLQFNDKSLEYFADLSNFVLPQLQKYQQQDSTPTPTQTPTQTPVPNLTDDDQLIAMLRKGLYDEGALQKFTGSTSLPPQAWDNVVAALQRKIFQVEMESQALDVKAKQLQQDISRESALEAKRLQTYSAGLDVQFAKEINEYKHAIAKEQLNIERLLFEQSKKGGEQKARDQE